MVHSGWNSKDEGKLHLHLRQSTPATPGQSEKKPFYIPVRTSFLDAQGHDVRPCELNSEGLIILNKAEQDYEFTLNDDCLPVLLRDFSAPVKLNAQYTDEELTRILTYCDDPFMRVDAAVTMQNRYVHENLNREVFTEPDRLIEAYRKILTNVNDSTDLILLNELIRIQDVESLIQTIEGQIDIDQLAKIRAHLESAVAVALMNEFKKIYETVIAFRNEYSVSDMGRRAVNNTALHMLSLGLLSSGKGELASSIVLEHYRKDSNMTDRLQALQDAVHLNLECRSKLLKSFEKIWGKDALVFDNYFRVQATVPNAQALDYVTKLIGHKAYDATNPNRVRALVGAMALSNPVALHDKSGKGYNILCDEVKKLNSINPSVAARIITPLLSFKRFDEDRQKMIRAKLSELISMPHISRAIYEKLDSALKQ